MIDDLLLYFDSEGLVFSRFEVELVKENEKYRVVGRACGEPFDPQKHEYGTIVKAMTYAEMKIENINKCWRVQFVVDI